jgi:peptidoglycan hydrolase-like protein with peptidoglycan-binding domain
MKTNVLKGIAVACLLVVPGVASANDEFVKGLIGVIAGGVGQAIVNDQGRRNEQLQIEAQRQQEQLQLRAEIQRRLNVLGFDAGVPDGSFGGRTRSAISKYQASIGQKSTGKITEAQVNTLYRLSDSRSVAQAGRQDQQETGARKNLLAKMFGQQDGETADDQTATAYVEPSTASAAQAKNSQAWQEPSLPATGPVIAQTNSPQAWSEPAVPSAKTAGQPVQPAQQADSTESIRTVIQNAICSADSSSVASIKSFIAAQVVDKAFVDREMRIAINQCVSSRDVPLAALFDINGKDVTVPYWANIRKVTVGSEKWYGHSNLRSNDSEWVRLDMSYPQYVLLNSSVRGSSYRYLEDPDFVRQFKGNETKRDCLGFPPIYYAAMKENLTFFGWLLDNGANPNVIVPFAGAAPSVAAEALNMADKIKGNGSTGYTLNPQYGCVNLGPSSALMNSYASQDALVPVWSLALRMLKRNGSENFAIIKKMLDMVPSVPPSMIVDIIDDDGWSIKINEPQDIEIVKILVSKGADVNATTRKGKRPLALWTADGIGKASLEQVLALGARI